MQHKQLIAIINKLIENRHLSVDSEIITDVLGELREYAWQHFSDEEQLMELNGFPDLEQHRQEHREFFKQLMGITLKAMHKQGDTPEVLFDLLQSWLYDHLLDTDMRYRDYYQDKALL